MKSSDIATTKYDIFVEVLCLILLVGTTGYLLAVWQNIPDRIVVHYNLAGHINRMADKTAPMLLFLPAIGWGLYLLVTIVGRFPRLWNTGVKVTDQNRQQVYRTLKSMMGTMKLAVVAILSILNVYGTVVRPLPGWFLPGALVLMLGTLFFFTARLMKAR